MFVTYAVMTWYGVVFVAMLCDEEARGSLRSLARDAYDLVYDTSAYQLSRARDGLGEIYARRRSVVDS